MKLDDFDVQPDLEGVHKTFRKWLGDSYDLDVIDAVLAAAAAERLGGDPLWLLVLSGPGNAKTETVVSLAGVGAHITSTITSEGALLSASPKKEKAKDATGGLLRKIGGRGLLVIKDVTSILSADRNVRSQVLAALREIHDGHWERNVGIEGGRTLTWKGRIVIIGAVTSAWDRAHGVIATMGDRFVIVRPDSHDGRDTAGRRAMRNTGVEDTMREELAAAVAGVLAGVDDDQAYKLTDDDVERLLAAADLVTLARTNVDRDYQGNVVDADMPEMPTRFAKQLAQVMRGAIAVGMDHDRALELALRCARDSVPPLRLAILIDVAANPHTATHEVVGRLDKPRTTVDRELQSLHMLRMLTADGVETTYRGRDVTRWHYTLAEHVDPTVLIHQKCDQTESGETEEGVPGPSHKSGEYDSGDSAADGDTPPMGGDDADDVDQAVGTVMDAFPGSTLWEML